MNGYNLLEVTARDILCVINPSKYDWTIRDHIINELRAIVESIESLRGATVEPFGSFVSDLFTKWGDLDISIELQNGSYIICPGKKHKLSVLGDVLRALRKKGGFHRLKFISNARVPILKFESSNNISCDISVNNLSGQMKSKMLLWINQIDGRFHDLVLLVKEWAKNHHINDSKSGTLNSYSLSLLVVFHLQRASGFDESKRKLKTREKKTPNLDKDLKKQVHANKTVVPAILPPLKELYPGNMIDDLTGVRTDAEKHIEDTCRVNINKIISQRPRMINQTPLSQLFISFLAKFSDICSRASIQGISPHAGQFEDIYTNTRWLPKTYALFVEDPFEQPANTARTVSSKQLEKISSAIHETRKVLVSGNQHKALFLSVMVGPHVSRLIWRTAVPTPLFSQSASRAPPLIRNGFKGSPDKKQKQTQQQHKSQNITSFHKRQSRATNEPMQASTSHIQQVWKAKS